MTNTLPDRLPSRPLRNWLLAWHITTGDPAEVIARGFDLPVDLVAELLDGAIPLLIDSDQALNICRAARLDPLEMWPVACAGSAERSSGADSLRSDSRVFGVLTALARGRSRGPGGC